MSVEDNPTVAAPLALCLLLTAEAFDRELRHRLRTDGWPALTPNQSRLVAEVDGCRTQSELARRLGIARQSTHVIVRQLQELGILGEQQGPVKLSARGRRLAAAAGQHLDDLERELEASWHGGAVAPLRHALDDWLDTTPWSRHFPESAGCDHDAGRTAP